MDRILRAADGWQDAIAGALAGASRPIPLDERLLARSRDGRAIRRRFDRTGFPPARPAATLLAIYPDAGGQLVIPLTVRHADLRSHAGEVSLPGGAVDAADASRQAAALREAWEEVGLEPASVTILGELEDIWIPVSNFELRPVVGAVTETPNLVPHDAEVDSIVELPLAALFDPDVVGVEEFESRGFRLHAGAYRFGGVRVWGATAQSLGMLAHVLNEAERADATR
ncbi:MAG: CoA pyrophosphatase [Chloroflexota bacterium]|jgi:8-oxo-dGTP pyrophosphatase MutT (NUDIX family)|nr:CoA pyrophosphatase [Chloroflexota bacterium]